MPHNYRDIGMIGDCQKEVLKLAEMLGWKVQVQHLVTQIEGIAKVVQRIEITCNNFV